MGGRADEVMMRDIKGGVCGILSLAEEAMLSPKGLVVSFPLRWAAKYEEQVEIPPAVIVCVTAVM